MGARLLELAVGDRAGDRLPAAIASQDLEDYDRFVRPLVQHCVGRVHYWQCDNEPSVGLTWAGTADSYLAQLRVMHRTVKEADPNAAVVLGGAPYALPSSAPDSPERQLLIRGAGLIATNGRTLG
jgi:hypothetical protein